jgi:general secretion pathway protein F
MPLDQALLAVAEQADDPRAARLFTEARAQVSAGEPSRGACAMAENVLRALSRPRGGGGGNRRAPDVLTRLADYLEARQAQKQQFALALVYPRW